MERDEGAPPAGGAINHKRILLVVDIEGSSGCWSREASAFKTPAWARACEALSRDADAVVRALFEAGAERVVVKDFHRSAYNLLPELIDSRAELVLGYRNGSVPGMGSPEGLDAVAYIGMHAASGTDGFLAHTMTSRLARVEAEGRIVSEFELFSAALSIEGIEPIFFSGCPVACAQALAARPGLAAYPIDKAGSERDFDAQAWRKGLARAAAASLRAPSSGSYPPGPPLRARVIMRDGEKAARAYAMRWSLPREGDAVIVAARDLADLYFKLILLCYFTPFLKAVLPLALFLSNARGKAGLSWARKRLKKREVDRVLRGRANRA